MKANQTRTSRRAFFVKGGATLGAGVATAAGAAPLAPAAAAPAASSQDREAIRSVHAAFIAGVERQTLAAALATHHAYRANALQEKDQLQVSADGRQASAVWHVDVKVGTPLEGDSTPAQMARLQGMLADVHWESGMLHGSYVKVEGAWQLAGLRFEAA